MGAQAISDRKRRRASERTGLPIARLLVNGNYNWMGRIESPAGHCHVRIDPRDWSWEAADNDMCWTTCKEAGPRRTFADCLTNVRPIVYPDTTTDEGT